MKFTGLKTVRLLPAALLAVSVLVPAGVSARDGRIELRPETLLQWEDLAHDEAPRAAAVRLAEAPVVDGALDEAAWAPAASIERFGEVSGLPESAAEWVRVKLGYTDEALFVGGRLAFPGPVLRAQVTDNFGSVWHDDAFEFFLYDHGSDTRYQVDLNANGAYWAGSNRPELNWRPALSAAAVKGDGYWTFELEIPWSAVAIENPERASLGLQVRYLVNNQAGLVTWAPGEGAGRLELVADADEAVGGLVARRVLFPGLLPAGRSMVGFEIENPTGGERRAQVRVINPADGRAESTVYEDIPARSRQVVLASIEVPAGERVRRTLLFRDFPDGGGHSELRWVAALPELEFTLDRERLWAGERAATGELLAGLDEETRAGSRLRLELWGRRSMIAEREVFPLDAERYAASVLLDGLEPGAYRLALELSGSREASRLLEFEVRRSAPLPESRRVSLQVDWPAGIEVPGEVPLYAGLSFPGGTLTDEGMVRVVDGTGAEVRSQSEVKARWGPGGSIRWLGLYFSGRPGVEYFAEFGSGVRRGDFAGVTVGEGPGALVVDTGAARFELPRTGPLFGEVAAGGRRVLAGGEACLLVTDQLGRVGDETGGPPGEGPVVEVSGPERVIVRRSGYYRDADGARLARYLVRLAFSAGSGRVAIQHSLILVNDTNETWFRDVSLRVRPSFEAPWRAVFDESAAGERLHAVTLDPSRGEGAHLFQEVYRHHFQEESRFEISSGGPGGRAARVEGEEGGSWGAVTGDGLGVSWTIRNLAKTFPKEIDFGPGGAVARLWSGRGGRELDFRAETLIDYWGAEWFDRGFPGGAEAARRIVSNAAGTARTHDLCLHVFDAGQVPEESVAALARLADRPALAIQDPAWLAESDALGPIHPRDPERFPELERFKEEYFRRMFVEAADKVGDYGWYDFGSGPHTYPNVPPGGGYPRFYRYSAIDYMGRTAFWLAWARSGDRMYHDYASAFSRNITDYRFAHYGVRGRPPGALLGGGRSHDTPFYWTGTPTFTGAQGNEWRHFLYHYYLAGDRWAVEALGNWADWMAREFDPLPGIGRAHSMHVVYWTLAQAYEATWDERLGRLLRLTRQNYLDPASSTGLFDTPYFGATYKYRSEVFGALSDWLATGAALPREAFLKSARKMLESSLPGFGTGYQDHDGLYMAWAYRMTGDPRYASWIAERLGRLAFRYLDGEGNFLYGGGYTAAYLGPWNSNIFETIAYGPSAALAGREHGHLPASETGRTFYFRKPAQRPLDFDLSFEAGLDLEMVTPAVAAHEIRRDYFVGPVKTDFRRDYFTRAHSGLGRGWGRLTLPSDALGGEYRLSDTVILRTDAREWVSHVPEGAWLNAVSTEPRRWYFLLPAGSAGSVAANRPVTLRAGGEVRELAPGAWHGMAGGERDTLWEVEASGRTFLRLAGDIPPVLAENDPGRFFVPDGLEPAAPVAEVPGPDEVFVPGLTGEEGDRALLLTGPRHLVLPLGEALDDYSYQYFDSRRGTLEFWMKPRWTSRLEPEDGRRRILEPAAWGFWYQVVLEEGLRGHEFSGFQTLVSPREGTGRGAHRGYHRAPLEQGRWHHVALAWETLPEGGWVSQVFVDGRPGSPSSPPPFTLSRAETVGDGWQANNFNPRSPLRLSGEMDAVVDEVRLSRTVRYTESFEPARKPFEADADTLLLLRLDGDAKAIGPGGIEVEAALRGAGL